MAKTKDTGWVRIYRTLAEDDMWLSEPFTVGQAWVDLIIMANYADVDHFFKGKFQSIKRGQVAISVRFLAERWKWSKDRVARTLKMFEKAEMVSISATPTGTLLTIENYEKYQTGRDSNKYSNKDTDKDTGKDTDKDNNKNNKNEKNGKEIYSAFANVYLSGSEYQSLLSAYGEEQLSELIESLGEYKAASGREYKNDAAAIKTFARRQAQQQQQEEGSFERNYG